MISADLLALADPQAVGWSALALLMLLRLLAHVPGRHTASSAMPVAVRVVTFGEVMRASTKYRRARLSRNLRAGYDSRLTSARAH